MTIIVKHWSTFNIVQCCMNCTYCLEQLEDPAWHDLIFIFLALCYFVLVVGNFSQFLPSAFIYLADPYSSQLVYVTTLIGPFQVQQLFLDVPCVYVPSRCTTLHKPGAYAVSFCR